MKLLPRVLVDDEEAAEEEALELEAAREAAAPHARSLSWGWTVALGLGAALPRLLYLFGFTDPENPGIRRYGDVWHHWQIAYLTKEIGLSAPGGPRLWDLKGLDYFWGILHPLLMVGLFQLTGSIDIVLNRLVSLAFGVLVVVLLFHICRRFWGTQVALGAALIAILLPTSVMNDASGMLEPLGVSLCPAGHLGLAAEGWFLGRTCFRAGDHGARRSLDLQPGTCCGSPFSPRGLAATSATSRGVRGRDARLYEGAARPDG